MMYVPATESVDLLEEREALLEPDLRAALAGGVHRRPRLVGDRDAGHLVVEELGVAGALERQDAEQQRDRERRPRRSAAAPRANIASTCPSP